jgi:proteasome lid subunit RPN8/RPN11
MECAPEEACGLAVESGDGYYFRQAVNIAEDPCRGYELNAREVSAGLNEDDHVIIWHTHPGGRVGPSEGDLAYRIPGVTYLVVTVPSGEAVFF